MPFRNDPQFSEEIDVPFIEKNAAFRAIVQNELRRLGNEDARIYKLLDEVKKDLLIQLGELRAERKSLADTVNALESQVDRWRGQVALVGSLGLAGLVGNFLFTLLTK